MNNIHKNLLLAQETHLGWILSGRVDDNQSPTMVRHSCFSTTLEFQMRKFWEIEEKATINKKQWSAEEKECEKFYVDTTTRGEDGRYVVRLPFKRDCASVGRSKHIAVSYLHNLEKRFRKNPGLKEKYTQCIRDYIDLGHARPAEKPENFYRRMNGEKETYECFYLPHLAVIKEQSSTTKTRVVFHACSIEHE